MSKNLKDIIDLNKYPIHDLNSPKIKSIIEKCKSDLEQDSCSTLPDFILPDSLKIMNNELEQQLNEVYMSKESINAYLYSIEALMERIFDTKISNNIESKFKEIAKELAPDPLNIDRIILNRLFHQTPDFPDKKNIN